jgi:uncharacterized protein YybS (DUF2232 family)
MTVKDYTKDAWILAVALGIPILAASQDIWGFLVDIMVIAPFVWLGFRRGITQSVLGVVVAAFGIYLVSGSLELAISKGLLVLGISAVFSLGLARGWKPGEIIFWASLPAIMYGLYILLQISSGPLLHRDPITAIENVLLANMDPFLDEYRKAGGLEMAQAQGLSELQVKQTLEQGLKILSRLYPSMLFIGGIFNVILSFLLTRYLLKRGMGKGIPLGPFRNWSIPWYAIWGAIIGIACYLLGDYWSIHGLTIAGVNISAVYFIICVVLGVSVVTFFFTSRKVPLFFKLIFVFTTFFNLPVTSIFLALIGLFDMVMNLRKLPITLESGGKL